MSSPAPSDAGHRAEAEEIIKRFERAWLDGHRPDPAAFLPAGRPAPRALALELAHIDLEFRLKAGEPARVETYLAAFPALAGDRSSVLGLVAAERDLRRRLGDPAGPDEYRRRFPDLGDPAAADTFGPSGASGPAGPQPWPDVPGYEVVAELGRGGMGVVYKAREAALGRDVALKVLPAEFADDPGRLERFRREARTASALNHPHICTVHALGEHAGRPFIVMEFIDGRTLRAMIDERPGPDRVVRLVGQAARALAAAHAAGVVHRDVKPENVMARADGYAKVLDFGLAKRRPGRPAGGRAPGDTDPGTLIGTVAYMSPEQARGEPAEAPSDVFSLGVVLYQMLTGRHPFDAPTAIAMLHAIDTADPPPPSRLDPSVPAALDGLVAAMLNKSPALRPPAAEVAAALRQVSAGGAVVPAAAPASPRQPLVGRGGELAALRDALAAADAGRGSVVCVAGEAGLGKTALIDGFLADPRVPGGPRLVARGRCSERLSGTEAFLPVAEALADLLRGPAGPAAARLLRAVAPSWQAQLAPAAAVPAPSRPAMLREFAEFAREAARLGTLVLALDDAHWADASTADLVAHLAPHAQALRLLVVVAYRPGELPRRPLDAVVRTPCGRAAWSEVVPGLLTREDVGRHLDLAYPGHAFPPAFAPLLRARTGGNPLFLVEVLRHLAGRGVIAEAGGRWGLARPVPDLRRELPESVRGTIRRKLERLGGDDLRLLSAAAVQGAEFDSATVASALGIDPADAEDRLHDLGRAHGLVRAVREEVFPDGTPTVRYAFAHDLDRQALEADLAPARRAALGLALARALEPRHPGGRAAPAARLAHLYEAGRDYARAARYWSLAAGRAARVYAHREAAEQARRGLRLLGALPDTPARAALERPLQTMLGLQLQVTRGYADARAARAYGRARELAGPDAGAAERFPALWGLWLYAKARSELAEARGLAGELAELARRAGDRDLTLQAQQALAVTALCLGEPAAALQQAARGSALYNPDRHKAHSHLFGQDPGVACMAFGAVALWLLGRPDSAARLGEKAVALGRDLRQPNSQALAWYFAAVVYQMRRDGPRALECAEACAAVAGEHGLSFWRANSAVLAGWAAAAGGRPDDGLARLRQGLAEARAAGSVTYRTYHLGLLAEVLAARGDAAAAGLVADEALVLAGATGERLYEPELHRLRAALAAGDAARGHARRALDLARGQRARSVEVRAALTLARLGGEGARDRLAECCEGFAEGADTPDLREARAWLGGAGG